MLLTGHIATALIVNRLAGVDEGAAPAVLGALVPDAIDKTLAWVLNVVPAGRHIGHTPFAAVVLSTVAAALFGRRKALAFGAAYLSHLVGDRWDDGHVPWLMPLKRYDEEGERWSVKVGPDLVLFELIGAVIIVLSNEGAPRRGSAGGPGPMSVVRSMDVDVIASAVDVETDLRRHATFSPAETYRDVAAIRCQPSRARSLAPLARAQTSSLPRCS